MREETVQSKAPPTIGFGLTLDALGKHMHEIWNDQDAEFGFIWQANGEKSKALKISL